MTKALWNLRLRLSVLFSREGKLAVSEEGQPWPPLELKSRFLADRVCVWGDSCCVQLIT